MPVAKVERLIPLAEVKSRVGLSRSSIYARIKAGTFPAPVPLGEYPTRAIRWLESEVQQWIEDTVSNARRNVGTPVGSDHDHRDAA